MDDHVAQWLLAVHTGPSTDADNASWWLMAIDTITSQKWLNVVEIYDLLVVENV